MDSDFDLVQTELHRLRELRSLLLPLHKALMESEKAAYEQTHGPIPSTGEYFRLVLGDEWFSWLRPISQYIVRIDERLAAKSDACEPTDVLLAEVKTLLNPVENGAIAEHRYYQAIQNHPDVAQLHGAIAQLL